MYRDAGAAARRATREASRAGFGRIVRARRAPVGRTGGGAECPGGGSESWHLAHKPTPVVRLASMWKQALCYGLLLAAGTLALQWLDYRHMARAHSEEIYIALIAMGFLGLGIYIGSRVLSPLQRPPFDGNPQARASLGLSPKELAVLSEIAAGRSNKEIAARLAVSPNTVKTHVAQLYGKLGAKRRTDAVNRARELGIVP